MRALGVVSSAVDLGRSGHACWTYGDDLELARAVRDFLTDGIELRQKLLYVGPADGRGYPDGLAGVETLSTERLFPEGSLTDADAFLALYSAATEAAIEEGFSGLRIAAEVTRLVADPANWEPHVRWEAIADRYTAEHPMAALCCYDRRVLAPEVLGDLCAVHSAAHGPRDLTPFRLSARPGALALEGEVDCFSADALDRLLGLVPMGDPPTLDLSELEFADVHALRALARHQAGGLQVTAVSEPVRRAAELFADAR